MTSPLPIKTTAEDVEGLLAYLETKVGWVEIASARSALGRHADNRKIEALRFIGLIERDGTNMKLSAAGRFWYIDKEIRARKGRWEKKVRRALNEFGAGQFKKRMFSAGTDKFELDAASPASGDIEFGVDVKRIEARRDIHKRGDEIANKASKFKAAYPDGMFGAVIYYPFADEHEKIRRRIESPSIDAISFASETEKSIDAAANDLLGHFDFLK